MESISHPAVPISALAVPIAVPTPIARISRRWDLATSLGVKAHVTTLFPFLDVRDLTPAVRSALVEIARTVEPFDVRFAAIRRFENVVWIEPEPSDPFRILTALAVSRWPDHPPYGGVHETVIPHLTIVESTTAPLDSIAARLAVSLPFVARATALECWRQDDIGRWHPHWRVPLGIRP